MSGDAIVALWVLWAILAVFTVYARVSEVAGQDAGSIAAGVLWPIYLPYRLFLIVWSRKP